MVISEILRGRGEDSYLRLTHTHTVKAHQKNEHISASEEVYELPIKE